MRISDWSSDVCSSDLEQARQERSPHGHRSPMIAGALRQAVVQLPDASFRQVLVRSLLISITVFALLAAALWLGLMLIPDGGHSWIDWLVGFASGIGFFVLMLLLFPAVMTAAIGLFLDDIPDAVERLRDPPEADRKS